MRTMLLVLVVVLAAGCAFAIRGEVAGYSFDVKVLDIKTEAPGEPKEDLHP